MENENTNNQNIILTVIGPTGIEDIESQIKNIGGTGVTGVIGSNAPLEQEEPKELPKSLEIELPDLTYTYREVDDELIRQYNSTKNTNYSTICDIIAVYLKGQKILYTEAKTVCEQRLTVLMLPSIFITVLCSILTLILDNVPYGKIAVSGLGAITAFLLALVNYLKLDARAEAHRTSAYKFDKLQSYVEFNSGKQLFIVCSSTVLAAVIEKVEKDVTEIKETNKFIIPERVRYNYPLLSNMNIFAEVKKITTKEIRLTNILKDIMNESISLQSKGTLTQKELEKIEVLKNLKQTIVNDIISMKNDFITIDQSFIGEMDRNRLKTDKSWFNCDYFKV
uniref:Uncharacterized protein n=1 Tax=viral metagenome TaxID=1070528 RepID=A0A6C0F5W0_9ZZZZ